MSEQQDFNYDTGATGEAAAAAEPAKPAPKRKLAKKAPAKKAPAKKAPAKKAEPKAEEKPAKKDSDPQNDVIGGNAKKMLANIRKRVLELEEEKAMVQKDIKAVYDEAKANGFDTAILRKVIAASKKDPQKREEQAAKFDLYAGALGVETYAAMES